MNPIFISFYSKDQYYEKCSSELLRSCNNLGINIQIEMVEKYNEYWKNTLYKMSFIYDKLTEIKNDIVWIDIDTDLLFYHDNFKKWNSDILFASHTGDLQGIKASPLCIKYNERSINFMKSLKDLCLKKIESNDIDFDHDVLKYEILPIFKGRISIGIMEDFNLKGDDFTDGKILKNGISKAKNKSIYTNEVLRKNLKRNKEFEKCFLQEFTIK